MHFVFEQSHMKGLSTHIPAGWGYTNCYKQCFRFTVKLSSLWIHDKLGGKGNSTASREPTHTLRSKMCLQCKYRELKYDEASFDGAGDQIA